MLMFQKSRIKYKITLRKLVNLKKMIFSKGQYKVDREQKSLNTNIVRGGHNPRNVVKVQKEEYE